MNLHWSWEQVICSVCYSLLLQMLQLGTTFCLNNLYPRVSPLGEEGYK